SLLLGLLFAACLYGVVILQAYLYFRAYTKDSIITRTLVGLLVILNAIHLVFISHAVYHFLVSNFDKQGGATEFRVWTLSMHVGMEAAVVLLVHCYYARRIWLFCTRNILSLAFVSSIMVIRVARFAVAIGTTIATMRFGFGATLEEKNWIIASFATSIPSDVMITFAMIYFLRRNRRSIIINEPLSKTLILYIMHTAALPS
ncbi:hypothetical protein M422DRAFT_35067, partial [Sphaerobolus stellatus SS14]